MVSLGVFILFIEINNAGQEHMHCHLISLHKINITARRTVLICEIKYKNFVEFFNNKNENK